MERDAKELYEVGVNCAQGVDIPSGDPLQALKWYELSAEKGYAPAELKAGILCEAMAKVEEDWDSKSALLRKAAAMYRRAAEKGLDEACYRLGCCCENGLGTPKDEDEALKWYEKSGAMGVESKQALENRRKAAAQVVDRRGHRTEAGTTARPIAGSAAEQTQVVDRRGHRQETGTTARPIAGRPAEAAQESEDGMSDEERAMRDFQLGSFLESSPEGDYEQEVEDCYRRAANLGHADAQYALGSLLERRARPNGNLREAEKWYRKAVDQGKANAMYALAMLLYEGVGGVAKDRSGALKLLKKAASMGNREAREFLNKHLKFGRLW